MMSNFGRTNPNRLYVKLLNEAVRRTSKENTPKDDLVTHAQLKQVADDPLAAVLAHDTLIELLCDALDDANERMARMSEELAVTKERVGEIGALARRHEIENSKLS